jgi:KUP system potassium uptake protein
VTTLLAMVAARVLWGWSVARIALVLGAIAAVDATFLAANLLKIGHGGWIPLAIGAVLFALMWTWRKGRLAVDRAERADALPTSAFLARLAPDRPHRVTGTAVFMTAHPDELPRALLHNLKHNQVLHERVLLASVRTLPVPYVPEAERLAVADLGKGFLSVGIAFGFLQTPDVPAALAGLAARGHAWDEMRTSYFVGRNALAPAIRSTLPRWQERVFRAIYRQASGAAEFFRIPAGKVVELGTPLEI